MAGCQALFIIYFNIQFQLMLPYQQLSEYASQILWLASLTNTQIGYFNQMGSFPQTLPPTVSNPKPNFEFQTSQLKLSQDPPKEVEKQSPKTTLPPKAQSSANSSEIKRQQKDKEEKKFQEKESKKPKRPQTYLTQRAFYMKQKLKGKQKNDKRILRNRKTDQDKDKGRVELRSAKKKSIESAKALKKKIASLKNQILDKKHIDKIKRRVTNDYCESTAQVPPKITGILELNQFCRVKMVKLLCRQVKPQ